MRPNTSFQGQLQKGEIRSLGIIIIVLFSIIHLLFALLGPMNIMGGELLGNDGYTRLNRVQFIYEQGTWNESIYPRSNAPYGESIHWTKPMDLILLAGGIGLSVFVPFSTGLHVWGVIISPLLHIVAFAGIFCLMQKKLDRLGMILLVSLFILQPILTGYFMIGRPDHHSLILAIFSWFVVGLHWGLEDLRKFGSRMFIGCMGAFGLWVSVEFLVPIGLFLAVYTIIWIVNGKTKIYPILLMSGSMFVFSALFLCLERLGEDPFLIEYDRISLAHVIVLGLIFMVWVGITILSQKTIFLSTIWRRIGTIGMGSILATLGQWKMFPGFFHGPLVGMDPAVRKLVWDHIAETQPLGQLFPLQVGAVITSLGLSIIVLPFLLKRLRQKNTALPFNQAILLIVGMCIFIPLALIERRWTPYASILLILPYTEYVRCALDSAEKRWKGRGSSLAPLTLGLALLLWPVTVGTLAAFGETKNVHTNGGLCHLQPLTNYLTVQEAWKGSTKTILAYKDFGPEILYRTSHRILGTPMHRNRVGLGDSLAIMKSQNPLNAKTIIQRRHVDLIVICLNSKAESDTYRDFVPNKNLYEMLFEGVLPTWLKEVVLPEKLQESFRLFEVVQSKDPYEKTEIVDRTTSSS